MARFYRQPMANTSSVKGVAEPNNTSSSGVMQPICVPQDRKLLDQFRDRMRTLHYALATETAYRYWIVEFLRFHRDGDEWKHPATLGKLEIEAFLTQLATKRTVTAKTQNQAFSAILFLYKHVLKLEFPTINALRAKQSRRLPVVLRELTQHGWPQFFANSATSTLKVFPKFPLEIGPRIRWCTCVHTTTRRAALDSR